MTTLTAAPADTSTRARGRVGWIDGARGLSIVLMIASHVELLLGSRDYGSWFHLGVMRPVAPMFLLLLGMMWRPGWRRRHWHLLGAAVASQTLALALGFALPNIIVLMGAALLVMPLAVRWPVATMVLCITQTTHWPMPAWWSGYEPGFVLGFAVLGARLPADGWVRAYGRLGSALRLEAVGRMPLRFYLGHLAVLHVVATGLGST